MEVGQDMPLHFNIDYQVIAQVIDSLKKWFCLLICPDSTRIDYSVQTEATGCHRLGDRCDDLLHYHHQIPNISNSESKTCSEGLKNMAILSLNTKYIDWLYGKHLEELKKTRADLHS